jgi:predicted DNA-binding transcriptional regulator YafY
LRRYLAEVRRELDLVCTTERPGGARLWRLAPGDVPRKIEVRRTQAYALLAARRLFEPMRGSTLYEEIDMAAEKLLGVARRPGRGPNAGVADARLEDRFLYLPFVAKDYDGHTEALDDLFQAVADLRPLRCTYRRSKDGREDRVTIHPYAMVLYKDAIYCVGLHLGRGEIRTFLLDRMGDTECSATERFELPADFKVDDYFQGTFGIFRGGPPRDVVIDFDARVAEFVRSRRVHPSQSLTPLPGGGIRLAMAIGDLTELGTWILGFGDTAKVVEPPDLVERVRGELAGALALYEAPAKRRK